MPTIEPHLINHKCTHSVAKPAHTSAAPMPRAFSVISLLIPQYNSSRPDTLLYQAAREFYRRQ
jgi:hypothetical protein